MADEIIFRVFLALILICTGAIRAYYGVLSKRSGGRVSISGNKLIMAIVSIVGLFGAYLFFWLSDFPGLGGVVSASVAVMAALDWSFHGHRYNSSIFLGSSHPW